MGNGGIIGGQDLTGGQGITPPGGGSIPTSSPTSGGAPANAHYLVSQAEAGLPNATVWTAPIIETEDGTPPLNTRFLWLDSSGSGTPIPKYYDTDTLSWIALTGAAGANGTNGTNGTNGQGYTWRGAWDSATTYSAYDCVFYMGSSYVALPPGSTNAQPSAAPSLWSQITGGMNYRGAWTGSIVYAYGDLVTYQNSVYEATAAFTEASTFTSANWAALVLGINYRGAWAASTAYKVFDSVSYGGSTYLSTTVFTSGSSFNPANWNVFAQAGATGPSGTSFTPILGEVVSGSGTTYTLAHTPIGGISLYQGPDRLRVGTGNDYTLSGLTITLAATTTDTLQSDYYILGAASYTPVNGEQPSGACNGTNVTFTLAHVPAGNVAVYQGTDRLMIGSGNDFTISGNVITFTVAPATGDWVLVDYYY